MAKQNKLLPVRKPRDRSAAEEDSLLLRSAESLGRVIGALQRQLDGATRRLSQSNGNGAGPGPTVHVKKSARAGKTAAARVPKGAQSAAAQRAATPRTSRNAAPRSNKKR